MQHRPSVCAHGVHLDDIGEAVHPAERVLVVALGVVAVEVDAFGEDGFHVAGDEVDGPVAADVVEDGENLGEFRFGQAELEEFGGGEDAEVVGPVVVVGRFVELALELDWLVVLHGGGQQPALAPVL